MSVNLSFSELVKSAAELDFDEYQKFVAAVNKRRILHRQDNFSKTESSLLEKVNRGFPPEKWSRLQQLDAKMEAEVLTEMEYAQLTRLTEEYEKFCVKRIQLLKKLALLRNISLEEVLHQLGFKHGEV